MDGPFFSAMPFPARGLHSLSHVRYTPHCHWTDLPGEDPYRRLAAYDKVSRADRMLRDAARYLPAIAGARVAGSLFEVKTVLVKNETDDGRPILFERQRRASRLLLGPRRQDRQHLRHPRPTRPRGPGAGGGMNDDALIGHSGFVGSTLQRQRGFGHRYRSTDIATDPRPQLRHRGLRRRPGAEVARQPRARGRRRRHRRPDRASRHGRLPSLRAGQHRRRLPRRRGVDEASPRPKPACTPTA